jgi:hypothetical protein
LSKFGLKRGNTLLACLKRLGGQVARLGHARKLLLECGSTLLGLLLRGLNLLLQRAHPPLQRLNLISAGLQPPAGLLEELGPLRSMRLELVARLSGVAKLGGQAVDLGSPLRQSLLCRSGVTLEGRNALGTRLELLGRLGGRYLIALSKLIRFTTGLVRRKSRRRKIMFQPGNPPIA